MRPCNSRWDTEASSGRAARRFAALAGASGLVIAVASGCGPRLVEGTYGFSLIEANGQPASGEVIEFDTGCGLLVNATHHLLDLSWRSDDTLVMTSVETGEASLVTVEGDEMTGERYSEDVKIGT